MSVEAISWDLHNVPVSGTDKVVLIGIANHADPHGRNAWPAVATLARYASVSERAVRDALRRLEEAGHVLTERQRGGYEETRSDRRPNRYTIPGMREGGSDGGKPTAPRDPNGGKPTAPRKPANGGKLSVERGEVERRTGGSQLPPNHPEPFNEPSNDDDTLSDNSQGDPDGESSSSEFEAVIAVLGQVGLTQAKLAGAQIQFEIPYLGGIVEKVRAERSAAIRQCLADGMSIEETARHLTGALWHVERAMSKLGLTSDLEAAS